LAKVRCAFASERCSVLGSSLFLALPLFVVFGTTASFSAGPPSGYPSEPLLTRGGTPYG
jgi:hypothetical protein